MQNFPENDPRSLASPYDRLEGRTRTCSKERLHVVTLVVITKLLLARANVCRVDFRDVSLGLVFVGNNRNPAPMMVMVVFWNRNGCTLMGFVKVLGLG